MSDISDPGGAGRRDRSAARRTVDDAYAAGRISAVDRSLRMEQIDAASTRGDLAMVVRDLTARAADPSPAPQSPDAWPAQPATSPTDPGATSTGPASTGPASTGLASTGPTGAADAQQGAARAWPPPGYGGEPTSSRSSVGTRRGVIGCVVAAVVFFFVAPVVLGLVGMIVVLGFGGSDSTSDSGTVGTVAQQWEERVGSLDDEAGSTVVRGFYLDDERGLAIVDEGGATTVWTYTGDGPWTAGQTQDGVVTPNLVDLATIRAADVQAAVDDATRAVAVPAGDRVRIEVVAATAEPRLQVTIGEAPAARVRTYTADGTFLF